MTKEEHSALAAACLKLDRQAIFFLKAAVVCLCITLAAKVYQLWGLL